MRVFDSSVSRSLVARCERGEELYACLDRLANDNGVRCGCFQVMGALSRGRVGIFEHGRYEWVEHAGALEISSCIGNVSVKEGRPFVHCHAVLTDHKGTLLGGHVGEGCVVDPTAEIHMTVYEGEIGRRFDEATGLWILDI